MPTVADVEIIAKTLGSILAGKPQRHGALTVIPILAPMHTEPEWLTLAEAGDRVRITEVDEEGSVPELRVANLAELPLLLLDGEQLVGAKQNRILNMTVLLAAQSEVTIPVTCVERGRWGYPAHHSAPSDLSLYAGLRAKKSAWVSRSLREGRGHTADQQGVWDGLALKMEAHDVHSPTGAMHDFDARYEQEIAQAREALAPVPGQAGVIAYVAGRWAGLDLLAGPRLFSRAWPRLCAGYAADALRRIPVARHVPAPARLLKLLADCPVELAPAVGIGEEYRLAGKKLAGAALVAEERVAHLMAFPADTIH
jgi:ARG and Rhodanese-Phosphatase-superfamily-associated Protein domain